MADLRLEKDGSLTLIVSDQKGKLRAIPGLRLEEMMPSQVVAAAEAATKKVEEERRKSLRKGGR